ncbi:MAG: hypothetical protein OXC60_10405 [Litoreibacter sp.]|nr:hypothetical protein [Litoreibacter sp.]
MLRALLVGLALTGPAAAEEWVALDGAQLEAALNDTTLQYEGARQVFYKSGRTLYDAGRPSWGNWAARGDKYCSEWPPAAGWDCYRVERHSSDTMIRFISETGHVTDGKIVE